MKPNVIQIYSKGALVASLLIAQASYMVSGGRAYVLFLGFGILWTIYFALDLMRGSSHHTFSTFSLCTALFSIFYGLLALAESLNGRRLPSYTADIMVWVVGIEIKLLLFAVFAIATKFLATVNLKTTVLAIWTGFILLTFISRLHVGFVNEWQIRMMYLPALIIANVFWFFMVAYGGKYLRLSPGRLPEQ